MVFNLYTFVKPWLPIMLVTGALPACTSPDTSSPLLATTDLAPRVELVAVPFHPQAERDDCGPAALAMMLGWTGLAVSPKEMVPKVYTPGREGTLQADILQAIRREGRLGIQVDNLQDLLAELDAGNPVLVLQNLGLERWPIWHYAVAMGYDLENKTLFLHSGRKAKFPLSFSAFEKSWDDSEFWALTVTKANRLPATGGEIEILNAASGLEEAGQSDAATLAYGALLERWPDNLTALMGWGNARYADGDYPTASKAFKHAVTLHPFAAEAWNNLAYSLMQQDRLDEALIAAKEAINRGGPHQAAAKATLSEIEARRG